MIFVKCYHLLVNERQLSLLDSFAISIVSKMWLLTVANCNLCRHPDMGHLFLHCNHIRLRVGYQILRFQSFQQKHRVQDNKISKGIRAEIVTCLGYEIWRHSKYPTGDEYVSHTCCHSALYIILIFIHRGLGNYNFVKSKKI